MDHERKVGRFDAFASAAARITGHAAAATAAFVIILVWAVSGPIFGFSDTWQLIINTATTVLTFLMVFVIQNTINRDSLAMHVKLDELIRATDEARNRMIGSEKLSETVLDQLEHEEELISVVPGGSVSPPGCTKSCACGGVSGVPIATSGLRPPSTRSLASTLFAPPCSPGGDESQR